MKPENFIRTKVPAIFIRPTVKFDKPAAIIFLLAEQLANRQLPFAGHKAIAETILTLAKSEKFRAEDGELVPIYIKDQVVLLSGLGAKKDLSLTSLRMTVRKAMLASYLKDVLEIEVIPHDSAEQISRAVVEGILIGSYTWNKYRTDIKPKENMGEKTIYLVAARKKIVADTIEICDGVNLSRDLVNDNADLVTANFLEAVIRNLLAGRKNINMEILNKKELTAKGLNLLLAVNQGSQQEPKLIIVKYQGASPRSEYTAVIGKGITFDTGGLNLKPSGHIETMRSDMSGAAATIGLLKNILSLGIKQNIIFAFAIAENAIGSRSYKPGDVFRSYNGKTVEIGNTDAEGRLVLADAISYVAKNYHPKRIIDIATLTGACAVALGYDYTGLISNDKPFTQKMLDLANKTDDRAWPLPSYPEIKEAVKSQIADIRNMGFPKGAAGTLTAAEFLRQFTNDTPWVHLDIAGTAFAEDKGRMYFGYGATGAGVRLLTAYFQGA